MPTYEYQCPEGHAFEKFQKMTEKPRAKCPVCGKTATRKISGGAGLVFKGSGFYITDYGKDGKGPRKPESEAACRRDESLRGQAGQGGAKGLAKPEASPGKSSSRPPRRPLPSERRAPRRAGAGGRAARRRRGRLRARAAPRRRPWRPRHQPRHGAGPRERANPRKTAERVLEELQLPPALVIAKTEIAGPGFINFWLAEDQLADAHRHILEAEPSTAARPGGAGLKVNVEFVSANPTGPLHVGHGRGAALGDAIASLLEWTGHAVTREFYINDAGVQIDKAGPESVGSGPPGSGPSGRDSRGRLPRRVPPGECARGCSSGRARAFADLPDEEGVRRCRALALRIQREEQDRDLARVRRPASTCISSEQALYDSGGVERALELLAEPRAHLRGRGRALAPHHRFRRRQGPRAPQERWHAHLSRARHRLPRRQARPRLRSRDRRLGRRPPRLHPPDARGARRAGLSAGVLRRRAGAAGARWCGAEKR